MRGIVLTAAIAAVCLPLWAGGNTDNQESAKDGVNAQEIIQKFAAREAEFREARNNYTYRQTVKIQVLDAGGNPTREKWEEIADIIFTPEGKRMEKVVYAPVSTLESLSLTAEDLQDLRDVQPFVLTTAEIPQYDLEYAGREKLDEIDCYKFSVKPKKITPGKRYFEGTVWVDNQDLQIVKTYGKGVGELKRGSSKDQAFPNFETYREQIDRKYWFPTYTHANDTLHFKNGNNIRMSMTVKYQDYKHYEGKSTIRYGDVVEDKKDTTPPKKK